MRPFERPEADITIDPVPHFHEAAVAIKNGLWNRPTIPCFQGVAVEIEDAGSSLSKGPR
jgi:hypothetical protein